MQKHKHIISAATPTVTPSTNSQPATINPQALYRIARVLQYIPVSRSAWWNGVRSGRYPAPVKLGPGTTCWRGADIIAVIEGTRP